MTNMTNSAEDSVAQGFERDKQDYWTMREELLAQYPGKWVAVHKGHVVAAGDDPLSIMEEALTKDGYAYTNKVGEEDKIVIRQRRVAFAYDETYSPTAMPRVTATFHNFAQTKSKTVADAIPDTGADVSCLPVSDCQDFDLLRFPYYSGIFHPFGGVSRSVTFYAVRIEINGSVYNAIVEPVSERERLVGRDVLNQTRVTFDGPRQLTTVD
jgi:hypothetical protein